MSILPKSFYCREDVVMIAREVLGKFLVTNINGCITSGMICETEAYTGHNDRASHAFGGKRTSRTEPMFLQGGTAYVYLCYGIHSLFNIVTNKLNIPHAILVRGIIPLGGIGLMAERTGKNSLVRNAGIGPGKVTKLLGIHYSHSGIELKGNHEINSIGIWLEDRGILIQGEDIVAGPRIGVDYAGEDAQLPYRFNIRDTP